MAEQAERRAENILNRSDEMAAGERSKLAGRAREEQDGALFGVALLEGELALVVSKKLASQAELGLDFFHFFCERGRPAQVAQPQTSRELFI